MMKNIFKVVGIGIRNLKYANLQNLIDAVVINFHHL